MNPTEQDILKSLFGQLPEEVLSPTFQSAMMQRIKKEAILIAKRNKLLRLLALMAASMVTVGLTVGALIYLGIPQILIEMPPITVEFPRVTFPPYYLYFGFLVLLLLFADHLFRRLYYRRRKSEVDNHVLNPSE